MKKETAKRLIEVNKLFYQKFGTEFSRTRQRIQPGVQKIIEQIGQDESLLDIGCGNGEFIRRLAENGHRAPILGVDFSLPLLNEAMRIPQDFPATFREVDITADDWHLIPSPFSVITCFSTLHHIPGEAIRLQILRRIHARLAPKGKFIHSNWQFMNSDKLRRRILPWRLIGLKTTDVDEGDYLLDWRSGGTGCRYAHQYSEAELASLAAQSGFTVVDSFYSDGATGNLGYYQIWEKSK